MSTEILSIDPIHAYHTQCQLIHPESISLEFFSSKDVYCVQTIPEYIPVSPNIVEVDKMCFESVDLTIGQVLA